MMNWRDVALERTDLNVKNVYEPVNMRVLDSLVQHIYNSSICSDIANSCILAINTLYRCVPRLAR